MISGYLKFQTSIGPDEVNGRQGWGSQGTSDWDAFSRAQLVVTSKSDTEFGTLTGVFAGEFSADNDRDAGDSMINLAFRAAASTRVAMIAATPSASGKANQMASPPSIAAVAATPVHARRYRSCRRVATQAHPACSPSQQHAEKVPRLENTGRSVPGTFARGRLNPYPENRPVALQ
jgi:hypothetical protein